jgi:hypothetical protein
MKAIVKPHKIAFCRVDFFNEATGAFVAGYTNLDYTEDFDGNTYTSVPRMKVEFGANTGSIDPDAHDTIVRIPLVDDTLRKLTYGGPIKNLIIRVREVIRGLKPGENTSILTWTWGKAIKYVKDRPKRGWVEWLVRPDKGEYDKPTGLICAGQCSNALFTPPCGRQGSYGPAKNDEQRTAFSLAVDRQLLIVDDYSAISSPKTFRRGSVEFDGANVLISDWDEGDPNRFLLAESVSQDWVGQNLVLVPGCNRSIEACRLQWNNEARANMGGYSMPTENPQLNPDR